MHFYSGQGAAVAAELNNYHYSDLRQTLDSGTTMVINTIRTSFL